MTPDWRTLYEETRLQGLRRVLGETEEWWDGPGTIRPMEVGAWALVAVLAGMWAVLAWGGL